VLGGVIRSLARTALGDEDLAHGDLEQALAAAAPHGLLQPFLARSDELGPQLAQHLRRGTAYPELVARLLDRAALPPDQHVVGRHEALTPRELTMLRYLSTPLSHGEIAAEQFVSVNTVKTHVAKIYRKLGVSGRREAVRRAEELGLLG
jgi:LuxR family maltose regulon positive regulatory protein